MADVTINVQVVVQGIDEALEKLEAVNDALKKASSLVGDLAKDLGDMSIEVEV